MQYRADLDGLRAVAVTLVLLFHATYPIPGGFLGVDIFFTLSGYLITSLTLSDIRANTFSLRTFYIRRSLRLLPAALVVTFLTAVSAVLLLPVHAAKQTVISAIAATASVSNVRFLQQAGYFDADSVTKPLLHTWSLSVEEQFYMFWPIMLLLLHRRVHRLAPFVFATAVVIVTPFVSEILIRTNPATAFYVSPLRFYELLLGAALTYLPTSSNRLSTGLCGLLGMAGLVLSAMTISHERPFPGWRALLPCLSTALVIQAGPYSFVSRILSMSWLRFVGAISYSVYLVHWPIIVFYRLLMGQFGDLGEGERIFMMGAAFVAGYPLNVLVEKRFRLHRRGKENVTSGSKGREESNDPGKDTVLEEKAALQASSSPSSKCRLLVIIVLLVESVLIATAGFLVTHESNPTLLQEKPPVSNGDLTNVTHVVKDDFNGVDVQEVVRLSEEADAAQTGNLPQPKLPGTPYGKVFLFANGSTPKVGPDPTPGMPKIVFVGDSHCKHWRTMVYHISKEFQAYTQIWKGSGCAFLLGAYNVFLGNPQYEDPCNRLLKVWKKKLETDPPDTVVISARWAFLVEPDMYGDFTSHQHFLINATAPKEQRIAPAKKAMDEWAVKFEESRRVFRRSLLTSIDFVLGLGARVVLLNQVPHLGLQPEGCLSYPGAKEALAAGRQPDRCVKVTRLQALKRTRYVGEVMREAKRIHGDRIDVVFPSDMFCDNVLQDEHRCRVLLDGKMLYRDWCHVSSLGASFFALRWKAVGYGGIPWAFRRSAKA